MTVEIREFACWEGPEEAPLVRKWVPLEDYERVLAGLFGHACYCGSGDLDPTVHREDCAYRKWASPAPQTGEQT
jgi:hypothetical protein